MLIYFQTQSLSLNFFFYLPVGPASLIITDQLWCTEELCNLPILTVLLDVEWSHFLSFKCRSISMSASWMCGGCVRHWRMFCVHADFQRLSSTSSAECSIQNAWDKWLSPGYLYIRHCKVEQSRRVPKSTDREGIRSTETKMKNKIRFTGAFSTEQSSCATHART